MPPLRPPTPAPWRHQPLPPSKRTRAPHTHTPTNRSVTTFTSPSPRKMGDLGNSVKPQPLVGGMMFSKTHQPSQSSRGLSSPVKTNPRATGRHPRSLQSSYPPPTKRTQSPPTRQTQARSKTNPGSRQDVPKPLPTAVTGPTAVRVSLPYPQENRMSGRSKTRFRATPHLLPFSHHHTRFYTLISCADPPEACANPAQRPPATPPFTAPSTTNQPGAPPDSISAVGNGDWLRVFELPVPLSNAAVATRPAPPPTKRTQRRPVSMACCETAAPQQLDDPSDTVGSPD